jgi:hypothetical protein
VCVCVCVATEYFSWIDTTEFGSKDTNGIHLESYQRERLAFPAFHKRNDFWLNFNLFIEAIILNVPTQKPWTNC